jgi:hypothetical protein
MVGVACPMLHDHPSRGMRFATGLLVGLVAGSLLLAVAAYWMGLLARALISHELRVVLLACVCLLLGVLDLTNRTPQLWRQVPQRLVWRLPPGVLGTTWGFDLGLLFTTQKVASLLWAALAAVVLLEPSSAPAVVLISAAGFFVTVLSASFRPAGKPISHGSRADLRRERLLRIASGATLLALGGMVVG